MEPRTPPDPVTERRHDAAVDASFPASDPLPSAAPPSARAVDVADLHQAAPPLPPDAQPIERRFADAEAAKLALERLVREAPLDRRHTDILPINGGAVLRVHAIPADAERLRTLLAAA